MHYNLKILTVEQQLQVQLSSLMWDYDHDTLPESLKVHFKRANLVHNTIVPEVLRKEVYFMVKLIPPNMESNLLNTKVLNGLKNMPVYQNSPSKPIFLKELKSHLLS